MLPFSPLSADLPAVIRALEQDALKVINNDPIEALRLALTASEMRRSMLAGGER